MTAERIQFLREENNLTQSDLARELGITRSSVNAWEQGISVPSTQYIKELAILFNVSTDYLLGLNEDPVIRIEGLADDDYKMLYRLANYFKKIRSSIDT